MAFASGNGLRLGHEVLWTYGPLGTLFEGAYDPHNYGRTLVFAGLLSAVSTAGFAYIAHPRATVLLLLLPIISARELMYDAWAASLALVFLLAVSSNRQDRTWAAPLAGLAFASGMLADVKESYVLPAAARLSVGGLFLLFRRAYSIALLVTGCGLLDLLLPWLIMEQRLG